jgi:hypothetical protein
VTIYLLYGTELLRQEVFKHLAFSTQAAANTVGVPATTQSARYDVFAER